MNLKCKRSDLVKLLDNAKAVVDKKATLPILQNVLLQTFNGRLVLRSTDHEVTYQGSCPAEISAEGEACVFAAKLYELVKLLPRGEVRLTAEGEDLRLAAARVRYLVRGLAAKDFPEAPRGKTEALELDGGTGLASALGRVLFSASTDETRFALNGVLLEPNPDGFDQLLRFVATDGHRLARADLELETPLALGKGILLPLKGAAALHKVLGEGQAVLGLSEKLVTLETNGHLLRIRPLADDYPDYAAVIPSKQPHRVQVRRQDLNEALKRVAAIEAGRERTVNLVLAENHMEINSQADRFGEADEYLEVEYGGPALSIGLNPTFLTEVCAVLIGEEISLAFKDAAGPLVVTSSADADAGFMAVIMPKRME